MYSLGLMLALSILCQISAAAVEGPQKRIPLGFHGMRGKKWVDEALPDAELGRSHVATVKRGPSGFMGMRGKKLFAPWPGAYPGGVFRRTPSGFMGVRGKKLSDFEFDDDFSKRAPSGFVGMRGKKDDTSVFLENEDALFEEKRGPSGFFGMRGKKYPSGFRGKFVGVRGKKNVDVGAEDVLQGLDFDQLMLLLPRNYHEKTEAGVLNEIEPYQN